MKEMLYKKLINNTEKYSPPDFFRPFALVVSGLAYDWANSNFSFFLTYPQYWCYRKIK